MHYFSLLIPPVYSFWSLSFLFLHCIREITLIRRSLNSKLVKLCNIQSIRVLLTLHIFSLNNLFLHRMHSYANIKRSYTRIVHIRYLTYLCTARAHRITYAHRRQISRALVKAGKTRERFCSHNPWPGVTALPQRILRATSPIPAGDII